MLEHFFSTGWSSHKSLTNVLHNSLSNHSFLLSYIPCVVSQRRVPDTVVQVNRPKPAKPRQVELVQA